MNIKTKMLIAPCRLALHHADSEGMLNKVIGLGIRLLSVIIS